MTCVVGGLSGALFVGYSAQMYIYIYMLLDNTCGLSGNRKVFRSVDRRRPHSDVASPKRLPYLAPDPGRRLHLISFEICLI